MDGAATCAPDREAAVPLPDLAEAAADAFTEGWLLSGCPVEFTEAEFRAAIGSALDCANDPGVLEATLDLGHLTGTWKTVYDRRERLLRKHLRAVAKAWDACLAGLDARVLVRQFRQVMNLTAEAADPQKAWWKDAATTAAIAWLGALYRSDGYPALLAAVEDAVRSGMAEGEADALALAASRQGKTGFSIAKAFRAAYDRLAGDGVVSRQAADAVTQIVNGAAADLGRTLAAQAGDGGSEQDMTSAAEDTVSGAGSRSLKTWLSDHLWAAVGAGAVWLLSRVPSQGAGTGAGNAPAPGTPPGPGTPPPAPDQGMIMIAWITAGNPCVACQENESNGPYAPQDVPAFPAHPNCKCSLDTAGNIPSSFFAAYLLS